MGIFFLLTRGRSCHSPKVDYVGGGVAVKWVEDKDQELSFEHGQPELLTRHASVDGE